MGFFTFYHLATGRVVQGGFCPDSDQSLQSRDGCVRLDGYAGEPDRDMVDLTGEQPVLAPRPNLGWPGALALHVGELYDIDLSWPGIITIDGGEPLSVPAGSHQLSAGWPGGYDVMVEAWPARPHTMRVEVT